MANSPVIILGMHRSGTSLLTEWLRSCGLDVGERLYAASYYNPHGHFEDIDFLRPHERFLRARKLDAMGVFGARPINLEPSEKAVLRNLLAEKMKGNKPWGWKEPRTVIFLANYVELLPKAYAVIIFRSPENVVASLMRRHIRKEKKKFQATSLFSARRKFYHWRRFNFPGAARPAIYLNAWLVYNTILYRFYEKNSNRSILINLDELPGQSTLVFQQLKDWIPEFKYEPFEKVYDPGFINKSLEGFTYDKIDNRLRARARELYFSLQSVKSFSLPQSPIKP